MWHWLRSKDKLISDILLCDFTHGCSNFAPPARTYIVSVNMGYSLEDLPGTMDDRDGWWEWVKSTLCSQHDMMMLIYGYILIFIHKEYIVTAISLQKKSISSVPTKNTYSNSCVSSGQIHLCKFWCICIVFAVNVNPIHSHKASLPCQRLTYFVRELTWITCWLP